MSLVALLDSNVWVSAFLKPSGPPGQVIGRWQRGEFRAVTSLPQLREIADVLSRPRLVRRWGYSVRDAETFLRLIEARAPIVPVAGELRLCRDPDDDAILEAAIRAKAKYLVTRDDDLKRDPDLVAAARRHEVRVVSVRQFLNLLARRPRQPARGPR